MKKVIGIAIIVVIAAWAFRYHLPSATAPVLTATPQVSPAGWLTYSNPDLGISFDYPPEWGTVSYRDQVLWFSDNADVRIGPFTGVEAVTCPFPKKIQTYHQYYADGFGYCKQFVDDHEEQMFEEIRIGTLPQAGGPYLTQHAFVSTFEFSQSFPEYDSAADARSYLQSLLDRTADPAVLAKIDTFEKVMLSLNVQ